jgi:phospholipid/cholesterol/gamma-HCH transport system substrate-binding protein
VFIIAAFAALVYAIVNIGGPASWWGDQFKMTVYFSSASELRPGNDVWLDGLLVGRVANVELNRDPNQPGRVAVELEIDPDYADQIRKDSVIGIESSGLLGDKTIQITSGSEIADPVPDGGAVQGAEVGDIRRIIQGTDEIVANFKVLSDNLTTISQNVITLSENVNKGQGSFGKFLTDTEIHDNLSKAVLELQGLVADIRSGPGTAGRLITDPEIYDRTSALLTKFDSVAARLDRGEGSAGKFLSDPALFDRMEQLLQRTENIISRVDRGEGSLGKILGDEKFYNELNSMIAQVNGLVSAIQAGNGTTGRLINDPTLFNSMDQAASEVQKLMYDIRREPKKYLTINFRFF